MSYGIIFWGNSDDSKKVFYIQKKIIRIMAGTKRTASCGELFKLGSFHIKSTQKRDFSNPTPSESNYFL
jgi:hypothetical protein